MNKTVLITGSSKGIGRATALLFAKNNWNVVATMRNPEAETELNQLDNVLVNRLDLEDIPSIENSIQEAIERFGKIDLLVNNAAFGQYGLFEAIKPEQIEKQFSVNVFGTMNVTRAILPHFRANKGGTIINISSAGGRIALPLISMYMSSKFALEGFSESISYELASQNIVVKMIEPGGVDTPFHETTTGVYASNPALTDYDEYVTAFNKKMESFYDGLTSAEEVAENVLLAATDGSDQFRYIVGNDAKGWIDARTSMNDLDYARHMRAIFSV